MLATDLPRPRLMKHLPLFSFTARLAAGGTRSPIRRLRAAYERCNNFANPVYRHSATRHVARGISGGTPGQPLAPLAQLDHCRCCPADRRFAALAIFGSR